MQSNALVLEDLLGRSETIWIRIYSIHRISWLFFACNLASSSLAKWKYNLQTVHYWKNAHFYVNMEVAHHLNRNKEKHKFRRLGQWSLVNNCWSRHYYDSLEILSRSIWVVNLACDSEWRQQVQIFGWYNGTVQWWHWLSDLLLPVPAMGLIFKLLEQSPGHYKLPCLTFRSKELQSNLLQ